MLTRMDMWRICLLLLAFVSPAYFASVAACGPQPDEPSISSLTVQEIPEWEPGEPRMIRQIVLLSDGTAQEARIEDSRIVVLSIFGQRLFAPTPFPYEVYFRLNDRYLEEEMKPGLIREGNPPMIRFIFLDKNRTKQIDGEARLLPRPMVDLRKQIAGLPREDVHDAVSGVYVIMQPLSSQERAEVERLLTPQGLSQADLRRWPALGAALARPSLLVHVPEDELESLKRNARFKGKIFSKAGIFVAANWGVAKVSFFRKEEPKQE